MNLRASYRFLCNCIEKNINCKMNYGQQEYDFDEGTMFFISPWQIYSIQANTALTHSGWLLLIHPDFFWNTSLTKTIKQYEFFDYSVNEALYLCDKEETMITGIAQYMEQEYHSNIDKFSHNIHHLPTGIIAQLRREVLRPPVYHRCKHTVTYTEQAD